MCGGFQLCAACPLSCPLAARPMVLEEQLTDVKDLVEAVESAINAEIDRIHTGL